MATNYVALCSNTQITKAFRKLSKEQFQKKRLIGPKNTYVEDTIQKMDDPALVSANVNADHMSQYIASSVIAHCYDGWNFLSRGIDALFSGDIGSAIHFTYYSELRAVMSLMAYEGIGIFNKQHLYFNAQNDPVLFKKNLARQSLRTHKAANELITEWASIANKKDVIFRFIYVNNRTMGDWIVASGRSTTGNYVSSVLQDWLRSWSIDLRLEEDQNMRNEMSYRPHFEIMSVEIADKLQGLISIWEGMEPTDSNRFLELDKHLLRIGIEQLFKRITGNTRRHRRYIEFVDHIFDNLGESKSQPLYNFIRRIDMPEDHFLISEASKDIGKAEINYKDPLPMICRAILMLRIATGCANLMISDSSMPINRLQFWWEDYGFKKGITSGIPSGIQTVDLYTDISDSIRNLRTYLAGITTVYHANEYSLPDLCNLKQFQRICFWGMGI